MGDDRDTRGQRGSGVDYNPTGAIDGVFGFADRALSALGELAGVTQKADTMRRTAAGVPPYRIVEAVDAESGQKLYVVTGGVNGRDKAECNSPEFAKRVLAALQGVG